MNKQGESGDRNGLTDREWDVLRALAKGAPDKEIGDELHISIRTVQTHVRDIYSKLQVRNRVEAAAWYLDHCRQAGSHEPGA